MKLLRYLTITAAVGLTTAARAADPPTALPSPTPLTAPYATGAGPVVAPGGGCTNCGTGYGDYAGHGKHGGAGGLFGGGGYPPQPSTLFNGHRFNLPILHKQKPQLPVFQAAPWYNYWPYDGHFLTPAPISGPFYGPPLTGNFPVNPYFPGPAGAAGWGPIPGGPPPMQMMPPAPGGIPTPVVPGGGFGR